jgi:hypothetical protein
MDMRKRTIELRGLSGYLPVTYVVVDGILSVTVDMDTG